MDAKARKEIREWLFAIVISFVVISLLRSFVISTYVVDGSSMEPNFHHGDRMIVNKIIYHMREPKRGEVVVLHADKFVNYAQRDARVDYIKRVIALPGETVRVEGDDVYVNGEKIAEPYIEKAVQMAKEVGRTYNVINVEEVLIPEDHVFVMGDNRSNSRDSRTMGPIPISEIVGRSDIVFFPLDGIRMVRHK